MGLTLVSRDTLAEVDFAGLAGTLVCLGMMDGVGSVEEVATLVCQDKIVAVDFVPHDFLEVGSTMMSAALVEWKESADFLQKAREAAIDPLAWVMVSGSFLGRTCLLKRSMMHESESQMSVAVVVAAAEGSDSRRPFLCRLGRCFV